MTAMKHAVTHQNHVEKFLNRGTSLWVQGNEKYGTNSGAVTWWIGLDDMSKEEILEGSVVSVLFPIHVAAVSHLCQLWHKWETATWMGNSNMGHHLTCMASIFSRHILFLRHSQAIHHCSMGKQCGWSMWNML